MSEEKGKIDARKETLITARTGGRIGIMQPYFFPYLGYWQLINAVDRYVVYDDVGMIIRGWINRNNVLINGNASLLTLPLKKASPFKNINEIAIVDDEKTKTKLLKSISRAYSKAPYFDDIMPMINALILNNSTIADLNYNSIRNINEYLGITADIILSSQLEKDNTLKAQDKIIDICKRLSADTYINAIGGQKLYQKEDFEKEGIELKFLKMNEIKYKQYNNEFVPNLSIIDVMMFNSPEQIKEMLDDYELI